MVVDAINKIIYYVNQRSLQEDKIVIVENNDKENHNIKDNVVLLHYVLRLDQVMDLQEVAQIWVVMVMKKIATTMHLIMYVHYKVFYK